MHVCAVHMLRTSHSISHGGNAGYAHPSATMCGYALVRGHLLNDQL